MVLKRPCKGGKGSWVDIGLLRECKISDNIESGVRVSIQIENYDENRPKYYIGKAVSP